MVRLYVDDKEDVETIWPACYKNQSIARRMERSFPAADCSTWKVDNEYIGICELIEDRCTISKRA